ncbi:hypothetical protein SAMN04488105_104322 [Salipiger thiooxidans]|uniref:Uncharacterized protein n=1 Tax=Salipiger thiooxidans TaxID=282683 RepID=A0A1G7DMV9_9RHOB|nr:hypothetical protein SAMN04488105_104322 [Salipiger thiooxidans]
MLLHLLNKIQSRILDVGLIFAKAKIRDQDLTTGFYDLLQHRIDIRLGNYRRNFIIPKIAREGSGEYYSPPLVRFFIYI